MMIECRFKFAREINSKFSKFIFQATVLYQGNLIAKFKPYSTVQIRAVVAGDNLTQALHVEITSEKVKNYI